MVGNKLITHFWKVVCKDESPLFLFFRRLFLISEKKSQLVEWLRSWVWDFKWRLRFLFYKEK